MADFTFDEYLVDLERKTDAADEFGRLKAETKELKAQLFRCCATLGAEIGKQDRLKADLSRLLVAHITDRGREACDYRYSCQFPIRQGLAEYRSYPTHAAALAAVRAAWLPEEGAAS